MTTTSEETVTLRDGLPVYTKTWHSPTPPVAHIFHLHGFSDHANAYYTFPPTLAAHGIEVFSYDQRGWGRSAPSPSQYGDSGPTAKIFDDLDQLLSKRLEAHPSIPCFLVGHSMGGGIALTYAFEGKLREKLAGVVVWSPFLELAPETRPSGIVVAAGRVAAKVMGKRKMVNKLDPKYMSRDEAVKKDYAEDRLCHDTGTLEGIAAMLNRGKVLMKAETWGRFREGCPVLVCHGSGDGITDHTASERFVEGLGVKDKTFLKYDGWYHKLHAEPGEDKIKFANDVAEWILQRVPASSEGGAVSGSKL